jgi:hypothetical protein
VFHVISSIFRRRTYEAFPDIASLVPIRSVREVVALCLRATVDGDEAARRR